MSLISGTYLQVIKKDVNMVLVRVIVTGAMQRLVIGLNKNNFQIFEGKKPQLIKHLSSEDAPASSVSGSGFKLSGITTPLALNASQSTTFTATFAPQTTGSLSGTVTITSDASNPTLSLPLSGTGLAMGALGANPASLNFGSVTVGGSLCQRP
jgi:hypothetical protein